MPKPKFLSSDASPDKAVSVKYYEVPHFENPLHYHKELELAYIIEGYGTRYVGSSIKSFEKGDLVLVGQELTHVWISDEVFYEESNPLLTKAIVVKFNANFAGNDFFKLQEAHQLNKTFSKALGGLKIEGKTNNEIGDIMYKMLDQSPLEQILSLIQILNLISKSEEVQILSPFDLHKSSNPKEKDRMNKIIQYTTLNFRDKISLEDISKVANLSKSAFCRYFKNTVKMNYNDFLYEIRVQYACKLLLEKEMGTIQICYEAGFNNPSSFSQIFKKVKGIPPSQYRKQNSIEHL